MTDILVTTPIPLNSNVTVVNATPLNQEVLATQPIPVVLVTGSTAQLLTIVDNLDGTLTLDGTGVVDNLDGTLTIGA